MKTLRYQAVFTVHQGEKSFSVVQIYLDEDDRLTSSSKSPAMMPAGLVKMLLDVATYQPVAFADLKVGMSFKRTLDEDERASAARLIGLTILAGNKSRKG